MPAPCHIIPAVNDYNNEKDSEFCPSSIVGKFMFPFKDLFEVLDLKWDGKNGFCTKEKPAVYLSEGSDNALYIDKDLLIDYLERSGQVIVWTVLGEKQKFKVWDFGIFQEEVSLAIVIIGTMGKSREIMKYFMCVRHSMMVKTWILIRYMKYRAYFVQK